MHQYELEAVDHCLQYEFMLGRDGLPENYASLFRGSTTTLLAKTTVNKLQWLHSIWEARDKLRRDEGLDPWTRDPIAASFLLRHKLRVKRQRRL